MNFLQKLKIRKIDFKPLKEYIAGVYRPDTVTVIDAYSKELTDALLLEDHNRKVNIHDFGKYLELVEENKKRWDITDELLYKQTYTHFQREVIKELALKQYLREADLNQIILDLKEQGEL